MEGEVCMAGEVYKTDAIKNIDEIISHMGEEARIIYLKSERREIVEIVINESSALKSKLMKKNPDLKKHDNKSWFNSLKFEKKIFEFTRVYNENRLHKTIALPQHENSEKKFIIPAILYIKDFHLYDEKSRGFMIKTFLDCEALAKTYLLIASPMLCIPDGFADDMTLVKDKYISKNDIKKLLDKAIQEENDKRPKKIEFEDQDIDEFAKKFVGLSEKQILRILNGLSERLCTKLRNEEYLELIEKEKRAEIEKDSTISFIDISKGESVTGQGNYQKWINERTNDFQNPEKAKKQGTPAPKGVLLCGIPGTGKTAAAEETARLLKVPLIKFDISRIQTKDFGGSEERLRRYLERISAFGSCVVLIDEIEKIFSLDDNTHEVKKAMLSIILDWMQTRKTNVFTFITANNISKLPPELLRDGRISGRFFAFMPSRDDLCKILRLKLMKLKKENLFLFAPEFQKIIEERKSGEKDPFEEMFDEIAKTAKDAHRLLFMTGANIEILIEMTNRKMRENNTVGGYEVDAYIKTMIDCALSNDFVPQGQSNMKDIVNMWISAQERQYQDISSNVILPFGKYKEDGTFEDIEESNEYDEYMRMVLKERIQKVVKERENLKRYMQTQN